MGVTLTAIRNAAKKVNACTEQYNPFTRAIANGNHTLAWQIVLGNKDWLEIRHVPLPKNLEELAKGKGVNHHNGKVCRITHYKNGNLHGKVEKYYDNGQLYELSNYVDGKRCGFAYHYSRKGILIKRFLYQNGIKEGIQEEFYPNGTIYTRYYLKNNKPNGLHEIFNEKGEILIRKQMRNGNRHGLCETYNRGSVQYFYSMAHYLNDKLHGEWITLDTDGVKITHRKYKYGELIEEIM